MWKYTSFNKSKVLVLVSVSVFILCLIGVRLIPNCGVLDAITVEVSLAWRMMGVKDDHSGHFPSHCSAAAENNLHLSPGRSIVWICVMSTTTPRHFLSIPSHPCYIAVSLTWEKWYFYPVVLSCIYISEGNLNVAFILFAMSQTNPIILQCLACVQAIQSTHKKKKNSLLLHLWAFGFYSLCTSEWT